MIQTNDNTRPVTKDRSENAQHASHTQCSYKVSDINKNKSNNKTEQNINRHKRHVKIYTTAEKCVVRQTVGLAIRIK